MLPHYAMPADAATMPLRCHIAADAAAAADYFH